ncbi:MAG TPA: triphosphoribosyl-dephospho-CoA synthase, partial [Bacteroidales bacterium]|nr:triphosphoribosyl-dephospho-CoA synthase [Bacteroidales bacterium]
MKEKNDISRLAREAAKLAEEAILTEAVLTPKPGLVDARDSGAHKDMDIFTFLRSAVSLRDGFEEMFMAGYREGISAKELLTDLRPKGMSVEQKMFEATENINTHKGIIFSMGLLLASVGRYIRAVDYSGHNLPVFTQKDTEAVLDNIRTMTEGIVQNDFKDIDQKSSLTHGEKLYVEFGFTGIRGEAEKGYPVVRDFALPMLRESHNGD